MHHFVLAFHDDQPAPYGLGDSASWFRFYKLDPAEPTYIPRFPGLEAALQGDRLWIVLNARLVGHVEILRVERDEWNQRDELWFDAGKLTPCPRDTPSNLKTAPVSAAVVARWNEAVSSG